MKNARRRRKAISAEAIARLADEGQDVSRFFTNAGRMMGPIQRVNVDLAPGMLEELDKRGVYLPAKNLLASDPYQTLVPDIKTGYVIGKVQMHDKPVHQLAFTEKDAEYQLWVTGLPDPRIQGLQVINMALAREPRVMIEFSDWNLNPQIQADTFSFTKPADAKQIDFLQFPKQER